MAKATQSVSLVATALNVSHGMDTSQLLRHRLTCMHMCELTLHFQENGAINIVHYLPGMFLM